MNNWPSVKIKKLGRVVTGRTPSTKIPEHFGSEYPFITPTDLDRRKVIDSTERGLSCLGAQSVSSAQIPPNSVLVSCIGWQMGKVAMNKVTSFTNQQINTVIVNESIIPDFLHYSLSTRRAELKNLASVGTRTPILNKSAFEELEIKLPPLPTQRKIAAILAAYDDLIESNTRRIQILEEMARTLYREWFMHFRFPGHEAVERVDSPLGPIPQGWAVKTLGEIAQENRRSVKAGDVPADTPYFGLEHLPRRSIALSDWDIVSEIGSTKLEFKTGEILFGKIRPYFHKVGVAPVSGLCSSDTIVISAKDPKWYGLTLTCVSSDEFVEYATRTSNGTKMPRANWKVLVQYQVPGPPDSLLKQFNQFINDIVAQIHNLIFRNQNLRQTRDLLLPRLVSGEIDVSELEIET